MWHQEESNRVALQEVRLARWRRWNPLRWLDALLGAFGRLILRHLGTGRYDPEEHQ